MKQKIVLFFSFVLMASGLFAQTKMDRSWAAKKSTLFGIHFDLLDFKTPVSWKNNNSARNATNVKDLDFGFSLSYWKGLTSHIDFSTKINALIHNYSSADRRIATTNTEAGFELEPTINIRAFKDYNVVNPFLTAGIGAGLYTGKFGAYVPTGVGVQFNFNSMTYLMIQATYHWTLSKDAVKDNLLYSIGIAQDFGPDRKPKVVIPPPPPPVLDRDGDGINDVDDKCPDTPGLAALQGCPDRDKDGIADGDDACPDVPGIAKYKGCPIPDTDGDGINDEMDKCPTVKGLARYQGCPIPDKDGDGVNDEEDKCPNRPGPASNQGCPEISKEVREKLSMSAKNIFFATGSFKLLPKSFKSLDDVAAILKSDELYKLQIDGHTDAQGDDAKNMTLSDNRAKSVKDYLIGKGVSDAAVNSTGYGETKPVADNKTATGRAMNRRVEITISNY